MTHGGRWVHFETKRDLNEKIILVLIHFRCLVSSCSEFKCCSVGFRGEVFSNRMESCKKRRFLQQLLDYLPLSRGKSIFKRFKNFEKETKRPTSEKASFETTSAFHLNSHAKQKKSSSSVGVLLSVFSFIRHRWKAFTFHVFRSIFQNNSINC